MKETRILMGMPVTVEIAEKKAIQHAIDRVFEYFVYIDQTFSTYKATSEISKINHELLPKEHYSQDMKTVFELAEKTKQETNGYFDIIDNQGKFDPSGLVKGWAILNAAQIIKNLGFDHFYVEAGGDIQVSGHNNQHQPWKIGIKNPFNPTEIVKTVYLKHNEGIATSGSYERGSHIYNPKNRTEQLATILSITVIGANIYEADRFATAAFAMQQEGIHFIEALPGFEGYSIDNKGIATMTSHFKNYLVA
jgi:thiamine biosynthesis lipoprotein